MNNSNETTQNLESEEETMERQVEEQRARERRNAYTFSF